VSRRLIRPADHRIVPWRNGGGRTAELAVAPAETPLGFLWRFSMADVEQDGPFSAFPDCDRTLLLLQGDGVVLTFQDGEVRRLSRPWDLISFAGDRPVDCRLIDGPVRDLNVMVDRRRARMECRVLPGAGERSFPAVRVRLLYLLSGTGRHGADDLAPGDALLIEGEASMLSLGGDSVVYDVAIAPLG